MNTLNQPDYYTAREQQQRALAERATAPETRAFHAELAERYSRLLQEALAFSGPR